MFYSIIGKSYIREKGKFAKRFVSLDSCAPIQLPSGKQQLRTIEPTLKDEKASNPLDILYLEEVIDNIKNLRPLQRKVLEADACIGDQNTLSDSTIELANRLDITPNYAAKLRERGRKKLAELVDYKMSK